MRIHVVGKAVLKQSFFNEKLNEVTTLTNTIICSENGTRTSSFCFDSKWNPLPVIGEFQSELSVMFDWMECNGWVCISEETANRAEKLIRDGVVVTIAMLKNKWDWQRDKNSNEVENELRCYIENDYSYDCDCFDDDDEDKSEVSGEQAEEVTLDEVAREALANAKALPGMTDEEWENALKEALEKGFRELCFSRMFHNGNGKTYEYYLRKALSLRELGEIAYFTTDPDCPEDGEVYIENILTGEVNFTSRKSRKELCHLVRELNLAKEVESEEN